MVITGNEVQTVTVSATSGTYTLTYSGQTTSAIAFDATAATVKTALEALSTIGSGNTTVTGNAGGPYTITFIGALGDTDVPTITSDATNLAGASHSATVATVTPGDTPVVEVCYVDVSVVGSTIANAEVLIGQTPPAGELLVAKAAYYG